MFLFRIEHDVHRTAVGVGMKVGKMAYDNKYNFHFYSEAKFI